MSIFERALRNVKQIEGGYTDDPRDPGGATNHGISLRFAQQLAGQSRAWRADLDLDGDGQITAADIRRVTPALASRIYEVEFWDRYKCGRMPAPVGVMMFSFYVNMRPATATQILQRAINRAGGSCTVDGIAGAQTMDALSKCDVPELCKRIDAEASMVYADLGERHPHYEAGWQYRSADVLWEAANVYRDRQPSN